MGKNTDIRQAVEAELGADPLVDATDITVKNVNGDVALDGTVANYPQYLEAAEAAWCVAGITNVHNHLEVVLPPGDVRDDAMLTTAANDALTANVTVPAGVQATARNGNLTLTGMVQYASHRAAAERTVRGLSGLRGIRNEIGDDLREDAHLRQPPAAVLGGDRADRRAARQLPAGLQPPVVDQRRHHPGTPARARRSTLAEVFAHFTEIRS